MKRRTFLAVLRYLEKTCINRKVALVFFFCGVTLIVWNNIGFLTSTNDQSLEYLFYHAYLTLKDNLSLLDRLSYR